MGSSREIITFQIGNYSNYIGAHWWNIQESYFEYDERTPSEINHDVLYREGKTLKGQTTFTPRLILLDKVENIINLPVLNEPLSKSPNSNSNERRNVSTEEQQGPEKHEFIKDLEKIEKGQRIDIAHKDYKFDETVQSWCDYLKTKFHPKSVNSFHDNFQTDVFHSGVEIYHALNDSFTEKIRSYMEECDNLQGFQVLVDATDAYGGFTDETLQHLQDEYSSKAIFTVPVIRNHFANSNPLEDIKRAINILLTYQKLTENSNLLVPIGTNTSAWRGLGPPTTFPNIIYNHLNSYHTSAILASFLDSVTLKYRLRDDYNYLYDFVSGLNIYNKKICAASMSLPFPLAPDAYLLDTLEKLDDSIPLWSQLTPGCNISNDAIFYQRIVIRGIPVTKLRNASVSRENNRAYSCTTVEELVHLYLSYRLTTISDVSSSALPLRTLVPFPKVFSPHVSPTGSVDLTLRRLENLEVNECPVLTGLHCCKDIGQMLDSLHRCVKTINIKRFHYFLGSHMDVDEFNECLEKILAMGYGYASDVELR